LKSNEHLALVEVATPFLRGRNKAIFFANIRNRK